MLAASCTSIGDPTVTAGLPGYPGYMAAETAVVAAEGDDQLALAETALDPAVPSSGPQELMGPQGDTALPDQVAFVPTANPAAAKTDPVVAVAFPPDAATIAGTTPQALTHAGETIAVGETIAEPVQAAAHNTPPTTFEAPAIPRPTPRPGTDAAFSVAALEPQQPATPKQKKGFLASLFGSSSAKPTSTAKHAPTPLIAQDKPVTPIVASASAGLDARPLALASADAGAGWSGETLPGVRKTALFEITRKSGGNDDSDVDINEDGGSGTYQVASAAGLARLAPNGLLKQTESVDIACLKPALVRVLKILESHYGEKLIVTSGYRDPNRNRRARGARNSLHMYCAAADIQVPGISKWDLAAFVRTMPGRGGVGTYCHTNSVHVDVGPERDWNWRCRRRK